MEIQWGASGQTSFTSFVQALDSYHGNTKTKIDECDDIHNMFSTVQTQTATTLALFAEATQANLTALDVSGLTLARLGVYADYLRSPAGQRFAEAAGQTNALKYNLNRLSLPTEDGAQGSGGASGQSPATTGLNCLPPTNTVPNLSGKIQALNCLVFDTSHSFWIVADDDAVDTTDAGDLKARIDNDSYRYDEWLAYYDWQCTLWFDGPLPSCRKHDVNWSSLEIFDDRGSGHFIDRAWNPRNKYLADQLFVEDIYQYDCQQMSDDATGWCTNPTRDSMSRAETMVWAVRFFNNKGWPITTADVAHAHANRQFYECDIPRLSGIRMEYVSDWAFRLHWNVDKGCVTDPDVELTFRWDWLPYLTLEGEETYASTVQSGASSMDIEIPRWYRQHVYDEFSLLTAELKATNIEVGLVKIPTSNPLVYRPGSAVGPGWGINDVYSAQTLNIQCTQGTNGSWTCADPPSDGTGASGGGSEDAQ